MVTEDTPSPGEGARTAPTPFQLLCASIGTQVQMALGLVPDVVDQKVRVDLPAAQQGIDLLAMLEEKTAGNLDEAEAMFLGQILAQLRMVYVERAKQPEGAASAPVEEDVETKAQDDAS